jgi:UDP-N-acetylmuramate dehydrogenase
MVEQPSVSKNHPMATLVSAFGPNLEFARELAPFTSYRTGGRAKYFVLATTPGDVVKSIRAARRLGIPFFLLGGGTNILVADTGFDGVVIKIDITGLSRLSDTEIDSGAGESLMGW